MGCKTTKCPTSVLMNKIFILKLFHDVDDYVHSSNIHHVFRCLVLKRNIDTLQSHILTCFISYLFKNVHVIFLHAGGKNDAKFNFLHSITRLLRMKQQLLTILGLFSCCDIKVTTFWGTSSSTNFSSNSSAKIVSSAHRIMIKYVIYKLSYDY